MECCCNRRVFVVLKEEKKVKFCALIISEGAVQYEGPGVELPFPSLDDVDPLLILQLHHRYKAICLAIKHTLR